MISFHYKEQLDNAVLENEQQKLSQYIRIHLPQVINTSSCTLPNTCILAVYLHIRNIISNN
jgi:hypothetical protein